MESDSLKAYAINRQRLLDGITASLSADARFIAAWLTGSFAREEADDVSDLDLTVVVADVHSEKLCARLQQKSASTCPERFNLFSQFGQPAIIHENNNNAPKDGTFTFVLYAESALMVDWVLRPLATARRPAPSRLLFDKVGIPLTNQAAPESLEQRLEKISETIAFFWMMIAVTIKYAIRQDSVFVQNWLEILNGLMREIERLVKGVGETYHRGSWTRLETSLEGQVNAIRRLCSRMLTLMPQVSELGGQVPPSPMPTIEVLLTLADEARGRKSDDP